MWKPWKWAIPSWRRVAQAIFALLGAKVFFAVLEALELRPELWIARRLVIVPSEAWLSVVQWMLVAGAAGACLLAYDYWKSRKMVPALAPKPVTPSLPVEIDAPIWRAVEYVRGILKEDEAERSHPRTLTALRRAAADGRIKLRGKRQLEGPEAYTRFSGVHTAITATYWENSVFTPMVVENGGEAASHTNPEVPSLWGPRGYYEPNRYADLRVDMREIKAQNWGTQ
jgi:hypothetical protein